MTIEPVTELGSWGALRLPRAGVVPMSAPPASYTAAVERYLTGAADTVNRELSIARKAIGWWQRQGWIGADPTIGIERRPAPPDRTKALALNQIAALWRLDVALREKTQWKMLYESAARADEVLRLNVEDLYPQDKRGKITAKGGATEWIHWQSGTAQLLPRLIARRTRGPLFLTDRKAPAGTPTLDVCPETGRARLSYHRAEENTRLLANPLASPDNIEDLDSWTLHRLRHSALTHDAEDGTSTPILLPAPATPPSAPWSDTHDPASTRSPDTSPNATPLHAAARRSERIRASRSSRCPFDAYLGHTHTRSIPALSAVPLLLRTGPHAGTPAKLAAGDVRAGRTR
ncbi:tyrosine-type recombinase/integrase [Streptomyces anulatus]|uniref:tyrosine-type recombinase/integrase n=1 Tax=Streptomyces anulatus TaxID=1892 RepID=UPI0033CBB004